jgi:hypothetical protein
VRSSRTHSTFSPGLLAGPPPGSCRLGKTRAILKLAGHGAFALAAAAFDLFGWLFSAVRALFGFAAIVKRITVRTTEALSALSKAPTGTGCGREHVRLVDLGKPSRN